MPLPVWCLNGSHGLHAAFPVGQAHAPENVMSNSFLMMAQCALCQQRSQKTVWLMKIAVSFTFQHIYKKLAHIDPMICCFVLRYTWATVLMFPYLCLLDSSSKQLSGYWVGWMGCLQRYLWSWHEEERAHGEDASCRWFHLWCRGSRGWEVHDARMSWVAVP